MDNNSQANCYWITGLSGSGKTTMATLLVKYLRNKKNQVIQLDGDELRQVFNDHNNSKKERYLRGVKYSKLCKLLINQNINVVIGVIGLFNDLHEWNRKNIKNYKEIFLDVPIDELIKRDPKGLYKKAIIGKNNNVAGIDIKVEYPIKPNVTLKWNSGMNIEKTFNEMITKLNVQAMI